MTYFTSTDRLGELMETVSRIDQLNRRQVVLVAALRANEKPWSIIGLALRMSRQAAQQKFAADIEPLMKTEQYHCDCGWSIAYPLFEYSEAMEDIADHEEGHLRESTEYDPA